MVALCPGKEHQLNCHWVAFLALEFAAQSVEVHLLHHPLGEPTPQVFILAFDSSSSGSVGSHCCSCPHSGCQMFKRVSATVLASVAERTAAGMS